LELGLTQRDVARGIGRTRAYVSAVERGVDWDPDADVLVALALQLAWPGDHILSLVDRPHFPADVHESLGPVALAAITVAVRLEVQRLLRWDIDRTDRVGFGNTQGARQEHSVGVEVMLA
jgi:transcriptional regulator with XRE-family HTH domain